MAEGDPIKFEDLADPGAVPALIAQFEQLDAVIKQTVDNTKQLAQQLQVKSQRAGTPNSMSSIAQHNKDMQQSIILEKGLSDAQKLQIANQTKLNQLKAVERDNLKSLQGGYAALSVEYKRAAQEAKDLAAIHGVGSDAAKEATAKAKGLNDQLTSIDASLGNYQRNVGNYSSAWKEYGRGIAGVAGLMRILGEAIGMDDKALKGLEMTHMMAREGVRDTAHVQEMFTDKTEEATAATEAQAVANEEISKTWFEALGPIGLIAIAIAAVTAAIVIYTNYTKKAKEEERERSVAVDGSIILDKKLRDSYNETIKSIHETTNAYKVLTGSITELQGTLDNLAMGYKIDLENLKNDTKQKLQEVDGFWHGLWNAMKDVFTLSKIGAHDQQEANKIIADAMEQGYQDKLKLAAEEYKAITEVNDKMLEEIKAKYDEIQKERINATISDKDREIKLVEFEALLQIRKAKETGAAGKLLQKMEAAIWEETEQKKLDIITKYSAEEDKKREQVREKRKSEQEKADEEQLKANQEVLDKMIKQQEEYEKMLEKIKERQLQLDIDRAKTKLQTDTIGGANASTVMGDKIGVENSEYYKTTQDTTKKYQDEIKAAQAIGMDTTAIYKEWYEQQEIDSQNHENKLNEIKKEAVEKRLKMQEKEITESMSTLKQMLDATNKEQQEALNEQTEMLGTEAEVQATLAAAGKKNSMDAVLKEQAQAQEEQKALARKAHQEQEAMDLASLFIKAMQAYEGAGQNPMQAATKAMQDVLLAKALSAAIAGSFAIGVENLQGPGTETSDSILVRLSKGESVATARATKENPGLVTAMNEGKLDEYISKMYMPDMVIKSDINKDAQVASMLVNAVMESNAKVEKAIKSIPQINTGRMDDGRTYTEITQNGNTRVIITSNPQIINNSRLRK